MKNADLLYSGIQRCVNSILTNYVFVITFSADGVTNTRLHTFVPSSEQSYVLYTNIDVSEKSIASIFNVTEIYNRESIIIYALIYRCTLSACSNYLLIRNSISPHTAQKLFNEIF
jgi:hypothetical protein